MFLIWTLTGVALVAVASIFDFHVVGNQIQSLRMMRECQIKPTSAVHELTRQLNALSKKVDGLLDSKGVSAGQGGSRKSEPPIIEIEMGGLATLKVLGQAA